MCSSTISFVYFEVFFLKILTVKNFSPGGSIAPIYTKIIYDLTIAIINKCFEFPSDWLKIICIKYKCMQI